MRLTKAAERTLWGQHTGTGYLFLKVAHNMLMRVEVFVRPRDGALCRIQDGKPVLPIEIDSAEDEAL